MFRIIFPLLALLVSGCDSADVVSMTIEQRSAQTIPGLGLRAEVDIAIGDIETRHSPARASNSLETLHVLRDDETLAIAEDVTVGDRIGFVFDGRSFEIRIDHIDARLIRDDIVELSVYAQ